MADWQRAPRELACGAALGCTIPAGSWYCLVTAARKVRCTRHSGMQPPAEDAPRPAPAVRLAVPDFTRVPDMAADWQKKAARDAD
jgi:hypothetical protein